MTPLDEKIHKILQECCHLSFHQLVVKPHDNRHSRIEERQLFEYVTAVLLPLFGAIKAEPDEVIASVTAKVAEMVHHIGRSTADFRDRGQTVTPGSPRPPM